MTQDRLHCDTYRLIHEFLAYMLGVRRTGITEAAGSLKVRKQADEDDDRNGYANDPEKS
jgi:hypothetical protein